MNFPINKNTIALAVVLIITLIFFVGGAFDVLDYVIFKILVLGLTAIIGLSMTIILFKKNLKKNRPEDELQDDSN